MHEENERAHFPFDRARSVGVVVDASTLSLSFLPHAAAWDGWRGLKLQFQGYLRVVISPELAGKSAKEERRRATRGCTLCSLSFVFGE